MFSRQYQQIVVKTLKLASKVNRDTRCTKTFRNKCTVYIVFNE